MGDPDNRDPGAARLRRNFIKAVGIAAGAFWATYIRPQKGEAQQRGDDAPCFLRGTAIRTPLGYRKVEELAVGDFVQTCFAGARPIRWIGTYSYSRKSLNEPWPEEAKPVRIMRSAIDDNVPHADLYVTAAHALYIEGVLVPAGDLVNGTTIAVDDADKLDTIEYFHIMFDEHDVVVAEGAACESLLQRDVVIWMGNARLTASGVPADPGEPCAPVVSFNGGLNEFRSRLRSAVSPVVEFRQPLDRIRDRIEERGLQ